jgi:DNA-binding transcriptional LysR family regulator
MWRLSHLGAKLAFLRAGLGFGGFPIHMVEADLAAGALVQISADDEPPGGYVIEMSAIYRTDNPPGPAGRWFIERLKRADTRLRQEKTASPPASKASKAPTAKRPRSSRGR